jgi:hypothetical protein
MMFEPPDIVVSRMVGELDGPTMALAMRQLIDWSRGRPYVLVLTDLSRVTGLSASARRELIIHGHKLPPRALAVFGGTFAVRVVTELLERASSLLGSQNRWAHHFDDEASARAWLVEMRAKLGA